MRDGDPRLLLGGGVQGVAGGEVQREDGAGHQVHPGDRLQEGAQGEVRPRRVRIRPGRAGVLRQDGDSHPGGE